MINSKLINSRVINSRVINSYFDKLSGDKLVGDKLCIRAKRLHPMTREEVNTLLIKNLPLVQ